jgi:hypothetical protein
MDAVTVSHLPSVVHWHLKLGSFCFILPSQEILSSHQTFHRLRGTPQRRIVSVSHGAFLWPRVWGDLGAQLGSELRLCIWSSMVCQRWLWALCRVAFRVWTLHCFPRTQLFNKDDSKFLRPQNCLSSKALHLRGRFARKNALTSQTHARLLAVCGGTKTLHRNWASAWQ